MKKKEMSHPRIYLKVLEKKDSIIRIEYKDNKFDANGKRIIKEMLLHLNHLLF